MVTLPLWLEIIVAALLLASGVLTLASILYFSAQQQGPQLRVWLIIILLSITVPVTTVLLSRAALFRGRQSGRGDLPPALQPRTPAERP